MITTLSSWYDLPRSTAHHGYVSLVVSEHVDSVQVGLYNPSTVQLENPLFERWVPTCQVSLPKAKLAPWGVAVSTKISMNDLRKSKKSNTGQIFTYVKRNKDAFLRRAMKSGTRITDQLRQPTTSLHTWLITWDIKGCLCSFKQHSPKHTPDW